MKTNCCNTTELHWRHERKFRFAFRGSPERRGFCRFQSFLGNDVNFIPGSLGKHVTRFFFFLSSFFFVVFSSLSRPLIVFSSPVQRVTNVALKLSILTTLTVKTEMKITADRYMCDLRFRDFSVKAALDISKGQSVVMGRTPFLPGL